MIQHPANPVAEGTAPGEVTGPTAATHYSVTIRYDNFIYTRYFHQLINLIIYSTYIPQEVQVLLKGKVRTQILNEVCTTAEDFG